jgi:hypothetical protein
MIKRLLLLFVGSGVLAAHASTITFQPTSQTIALGSSTTVNVLISGLSAGQALGAFDLFVLNNSSIVSATGVTFGSSLGPLGGQLTGTTFALGSTEGAETSFETTPALLALQASQPFELFQLTYMGVGVGTSSLTLGTPLVLADGSGSFLPLPAPTVIAGSITVTGPTAVTPEPSSLALLGTGFGTMLMYLRRRRVA